MREHMRGERGDGDSIGVALQSLIDPSEIFFLVGMEVSRLDNLFTLDNVKYRKPTLRIIYTPYKGLTLVLHQRIYQRPTILKN